MIIKSMARKSPSFEQLINYFHKDAFHREAPIFTHNMWDTQTPEMAAAEFDQNATFLPKRANGNYLYHECIALGDCPNVPEARQEQILLDLVKQYVALRAPDQMVYGRMHLDTNFKHFHLCISANTVRGSQRRWLTRAAFDRIQRDIEHYKVTTYPELGTEKYYDHAAKEKRREKARAEQAEKAKISGKEYELKKRTGRISQKEQDRADILEIFQTVLSESELRHRLAQIGFELYKRGQTEGVIKTATGRKYRLQTLGLTQDLQRAQARLRLYDQRRAELLLERGRAAQRDDKTRER